MIVILPDGSEWRGVSGDGWHNVNTGERMSDAAMEIAITGALHEVEDRILALKEGVSCAES